LITKKPTTRNNKNKAITPVLNFHHAVKLALKAGRIDAENVRNKKRWQSMERAWETVYGTFPGFPKDLTQTITIYREISVNDPERIATEIFQGARKPGQYWAFDEAGSGTYMQGGSEATTTSNVRMEGEVPLKDIDPVETLIENFMNPDEYEAGLLTLDNLKLVKVEWMEQIEFVEGDEPHDVWHEVTANRTRKGKNKSKRVPQDVDKVYRRDAPSIRDAMRQSIESLQIMVTVLLDDDSHAWEKYWERRWKPDFPDGVEDFIDFERWFESLVKKAKKSKHKTVLIDIVNTLAPRYYHVAKREGIGVVFEADGVNAEPECLTIPTYTITFTGTNLGPNVANDGVVIRPNKVLSVKGPGDERHHVKLLNSQITKYYPMTD
jgi:hypothetical protein